MIEYLLYLNNIIIHILCTNIKKCLFLEHKLIGFTSNNTHSAECYRYYYIIPLLANFSLISPIHKYTFILNK